MSTQPKCPTENFIQAFSTKIIFLQPFENSCCFNDGVYIFGVNGPTNSAAVVEYS